MSNASKVMVDVSGSGNNMMVLPLDQIIQSNRQRIPEVSGSFDGNSDLQLRNIGNQSTRSTPVRGGGR